MVDNPIFMGFSWIFQCHLWGFHHQNGTVQQFFMDFGWFYHHLPAINLYISGIFYGIFQYPLWGFSSPEGTHSAAGAAPPQLPRLASEHRGLIRLLRLDQEVTDLRRRGPRPGGSPWPGLFYSDLMGIYGDLMGIYGDLTGFYGDLMGIYGHLMGFYGDLMGFNGS